jgi:flagella basal body P-ring formation protein FlgA
LWGIIFWFGATTIADAAVLLALKEKAVQSTITLPLGEVVAVSGDVALQKVLRSVALPAKGRVGDTVIYTRDEITRFIVGMHLDWAEQLRWSGAERVLVQRQGVAIAPQEYIGWAREHLQAQWANKSGRFELKPIDDYRPVTIPEGERSINARFGSDEVRRTTKVWLDISVDKQYYSSVAVVFDVRWLHPALVLKQRGSAHQKLNTAMVSDAEVDISLTNGRLIGDAQHLVGKRLRHDVDAGLPLADGDVEDKPAIELGDAVQVYAKVGRVIVQTQAVAQRDGNIGQRIDVKSKQTNEQLTVEVMGEDRAVVSDKQK